MASRRKALRMEASGAEVAISSRPLVQPLRPGAFSLPIEVIAAEIAFIVTGWPGRGLVRALKGSGAPTGCFALRAALVRAVLGAVGAGSSKVREALPRNPLSSNWAARFAGSCWPV